MVKTPAQLIEAKGGSAVFARAIGYDPGAVRMMRYRNKFPRSAWPDIGLAFPDLDTEALLLAEAAGERAKSKDSRQAKGRAA